MYNRALDGNTLTLAPSGWTYKDTFVLVDRETGSLWYPTWRGLRAIQGQHEGQILAKMDFADTTWRQWLHDYPDTKLLK